MPENTAQNSKNHSYTKDLMLLFAVPVAMAIFTAAVVYLPRIFANPTYDFVYSVCDNYTCSKDYYVDDTGHITENYSGSSAYTSYNTPSRIRYYDAKNDSTRSLSYNEARSHRLSTSSKSPDGYTLELEQTGGSFLFWPDSDEGWFLKNGAKKKKIDLFSNGSRYSQNINFLGWVKK